MKIGIIGYGNVGSTIFKSLKKHKIMISDRKALNKKVALNANYIYLCVKPNHAKEVCHDIKNYIGPNDIIISTMAGVSLTLLQTWLNHEKVVRTMPTIIINGPVVIYNPLKLSFIKYSKNNIYVKNENDINLSTAVSGCMPGFLANIINQWIEASKPLGMDRKLASKLICSNVNAFSKLDVKYQYQLVDIQKKVSSKGGASQRGIEYLNESVIKNILSDTMSIANHRMNYIAHLLNE